MHELKKQLAFTQTLIKRMSMMIMSSIITSLRIMQPTLFNFIIALHPNNPSTLPVSKPPSRITKDHFTIKPTNHQYQFPPKLLRYAKTSTSTSITQYHLSKNLLWSILSFTFPHSKDLQKVL